MIDITYFDNSCKDPMINIIYQTSETKIQYTLTGDMLELEEWAAFLAHLNKGEDCIIAARCTEQSIIAYYHQKIEFQLESLTNYPNGNLSVTVPITNTLIDIFNTIVQILTCHQNKQLYVVNPFCCTEVIISHC